MAKTVQKATFAAPVKKQDEEEEAAGEEEQMWYLKLPAINVESYLCFQFATLTVIRLPISINL